MRKAVVAAALFALSLHAGAQDFQVAARAGAEADYKVSKGFHIAFEEELRSEDGLSSIGSFRHSLSVQYKPDRHFRFGLGYTLINPWESCPRHRFLADLGGSLYPGDWQVSLKERFQVTHNTNPGLNINQKPRNAMALKSKASVKYRGIKHFEPYFSIEVRTFLNGAWGSTSGTIQTTEKTKKKYYDYTPEGYTHVYNNRYRSELGAGIRIARHHHITPYLLLDYCSDYKIDTNSEGTRLFVATTAWTEVLRLSPGIAYVYRF